MVSKVRGKKIENVKGRKLIDTIWIKLQVVLESTIFNMQIK